MCGKWIPVDTHLTDSIRLRAGCECYRRWLSQISEDIDIFGCLNSASVGTFLECVYLLLSLRTSRPVVERPLPVDEATLILRPIVIPPTQL